LYDPGSPQLTYVGGPTLLIEWGGLALLTDPTFDPAGSGYPGSGYFLRKTEGPAIPAQALPVLDAVLLSHDHHHDNLDRAGREVLDRAARILTTGAGARRLGADADGLEPWEHTSLRAPNGQTLIVTATPARHGPANADRGPVVGFVLEWSDSERACLYISGDTVWYDGVATVAERCLPGAAVLFMGAARVAPAGDRPLTFTASGALEAARVLAPAPIVPVHFEGWEHFTETRADVEAAFAAEGLSDRLRWLEAGRPSSLALVDRTGGA